MRTAQLQSGFRGDEGFFERRNFLFLISFSGRNAQKRENVSRVAQPKRLLMQIMLAMQKGKPRFRGCMRLLNVLF
jgi:hypothetical protein